MEENGGLSIADALALARGNGNGNGFGGDMGNGAWWIIILILFLGWGGGRGFGLNGNNNGGGDGVNTVIVPTSGFGGGYGYNACCTPATAQGMSDAFNFNVLDNGIRATHDSVVDGFYQNNLAVTSLGTALANSFANSDKANLQSVANLQTALCNGFNSVNTNINNTAFGLQNGMNTGFNNVQSTLCNGFNGVQAAIANTNCAIKDCCCETRESIMQSNFNNQAGFNNVTTAINTNACDIERGQDDIKYLMAQNQSQTIVSIDRLGDRLIDYMNQKEMDELRTELQNAKFQISQAAQTEQLLNSLQPISRPAYITASPYQSIGYNGVNGCGCGNF